MIRKLINIKCSLLEYVNKILLILATFNNVSDKNWEKSYKFCNVFQVRFTFHTVTHFYCDYIFTTNITAISMRNAIKTTFFTPF